MEVQVILNKGIQIWTVPVTGSYVIEAAGASGGNGSDPFVSPFHWNLGGLGAKITGTFQLNQGTQLKILVGHEGGTCTHKALSLSPGGGDGGSFVTLLDNTPLIVAGGGGGGGVIDNFTNGDPGQATRNGTKCGGTHGGRGRVCNASTGEEDVSLLAGGGAGISDDGLPGLPIGNPPLSFTNGGSGGESLISNGGFGGGSFAVKIGGGGGGYSGGGVLGNDRNGTGEGGGSYNVGKNQQNLIGANKGNGKVVISLVNP